MTARDAHGDNRADDALSDGHMLAPKSDFIGLEGLVHLATGGEPPLLKSHRAAFEAFARDKARGFPGYQAHWAVGEEVRARLAALTGLTADDFALVGSASAGIASVRGSSPLEP